MAEQLLSAGPRFETLPASYVLPEQQRPRLDLVLSDGNIPLIDLGRPDRARILCGVADARSSYGFFQVVNHGISEELMQRMLGVAREFFKLPAEEDPAKKMRLSTSFNMRKETVRNGRDYLRLHCYPLEEYVPFPQNLTGIIIQEGSLETSGNTVGRVPPHAAGGGTTWRSFTEADVRGFVAAPGELPLSTTTTGGVAGARADEPDFTLWDVLVLSVGMMTSILSALLNNQSHEAAAVIAGMPLLFLLGAVISCVTGVLFKIRRGRFHKFFKTIGTFFFICAASALTLRLVPRAYHYAFLAILVAAAVAVGTVMLLLPHSTASCPLPPPPPAEGAPGVSVPENGQYWFTKWLFGYNQSRSVAGNETTAEEFGNTRSDICV